MENQKTRRLLEQVEVLIWLVDIALGFFLIRAHQSSQGNFWEIPTEIVLGIAILSFFIYLVIDGAGIKFLKKSTERTVQSRITSIANLVFVSGAVVEAMAQGTHHFYPRMGTNKWWPLLVLLGITVVLGGFLLSLTAIYAIRVWRDDPSLEEIDNGRVNEIFTSVIIPAISLYGFVWLILDKHR